MSNERKWTPGPWRVDLSVPEDCCVWVDDELVCNIGASRGDIVTVAFDMYAANAHLIAAAPELYEALDRSARYLPHDIVRCNGDKCREPWCASCFGEEDAESFMEDTVEADKASVRAALAKARGEQC